MRVDRRVAAVKEKVRARRSVVAAHFLMQEVGVAAPRCSVVVQAADVLCEHDGGDVGGF
jgi:hypothetical protein